ncbi:MAG: hypothetical protein WC464_00015 [Bdellovibrionales bacterium]|jgi:hypothetical protein
MEPINYMGMLPQVNPMQGLLSGLQAGSALRETGLRQQEIQQKLDAEKVAQARTEQYRTMFSDYMADPKFDKLLALQATFPEQEKAFKPLIEQMDKRQLAAEQAAGMQITTALKNNNVELATKILDENIEAAKNSGLDTAAFEQVKNAISADPKAALGLTQWLTMHTMTPEQQEKFAEAQKKLEDLRQSQALFPEKQAQEAIKTKKEGYEATIKQAEAKIAPQKVQADYQKTLAETNKMLQEPEFERQRIAIARQKNAIDRETNDIARQTKQIQLVKMQQDYMDKANEKSSKVYSAYDNLQNSKRTIDQALSYFKKGNIPGLGYAAERAHGPISSKIMTTDPDVSNYERLLDTIGSQSFIKAVQDVGTMSGLTEVEGQKLQSAMVNLSLNQGPKQAKQNLIILKNLMEKSYKNVEKKYGINVKQEKSKERRNISGADAAAALGI